MGVLVWKGEEDRVEAAAGCSVTQRGSSFSTSSLLLGRRFLTMHMIWERGLGSCLNVRFSQREEFRDDGELRARWS